MAKTAHDAGATPARLSAAAALTVAGMLLTPAARAGLGEPAESVALDHAALHGKTLTVTPRAAYDVQETTTVDGGRVRQYVSRDGTVFAVAWSGRSLPDLKVILAKHYDRYLAAASVHRGSHHVLALATPDVAINVLRLPRGFAGSAHVPALLPPGTSPEELR